MWHILYTLHIFTHTHTHVYIYTQNKIYLFLLLFVTKSCPTRVTPWAGHQAPLSMGLSRQEYWNGLPFLSPRDLPDQESNPHLLHRQAVLFCSLTTEPLGKPKIYL